MQHYSWHSQQCNLTELWETQHHMTTLPDQSNNGTVYCDWDIKRCNDATLQAENLNIATMELRDPNNATV